MNVKFHKNCISTGKIRIISCVKCNFVSFIFSGSHKTFFLALLPIPNYL